MAKRKTSICSIYGQIEGIVADAMTAEGKVNKIPFEVMPPTQQFDERGRRAHCALVFTPEAEREYLLRVRHLYA